MHVISRAPFDEAKAQYPTCAAALDAIYLALKKNYAKSPEELKTIFPTLDNFKYVDKWYVIDIVGNTLRLLAFIEFKRGRCYIKQIVTHQEYDKITDEYRRKKKSRPKA